MTPSPSVESLREIAKAHIGNGYSRSIEQLAETVLALLPSPEWKSMESGSAQSQPCGLGPADLEAGLDAGPSGAWRPIESAPRDGTEVLLYHPLGGVCAGFCPGPGFSWHVMDGSNTYIGPRSGVSLPSLTSYTEPPTHWQPLPPPPEASPIPSLGGGKRGSANAISGPTPKSADTEAEPSGPVNCTHVLRRKGGAYPRTCERCGVGPCPFYNNDGTVKS